MTFLFLIWSTVEISMLTCSHTFFAQGPTDGKLPGGK